MVAIKVAGKKKALILSLIIIISIIICVIMFLFPSMYENICRNRKYDDMAKEIHSDIWNANICIITKKTSYSENVESWSYSAGASGVIIGKEENRYYALTAYHIVSEEENVEWWILPFGLPTYAEYKANSQTPISHSDYYEQFSEANVEYVSSEYDLAIISFELNEDLSVLSISDETPEYGTRIVAIGNPEGERFIETFGKIISKEQTSFDANDGNIPNMVWYHNAYVAPGSSGGAVLNENMEILGLNIGGGTDFLGRFRYGAMISSDQIQQFILEWKALQ